MRAILVGGPRSGSALFPMGPVTLAAVGRLLGVSVSVIDLPEEAQGGEFWMQVADANLVGFSTVCTTYPQVLLLARELKRRHPGILIVLGGPQATSTAEVTLRTCPWVDLIVRGEAEVGWRDLLRACRRGVVACPVPGAVWRDGDQVRTEPLPELAENLDSIPVPDFAAYAPLRGMPRAMIEVGRGCPYGCTFCSTNTFFKRRFRMKSTGRILAELEVMRGLLGVQSFEFIHDMFTVKREVVVDVCKALRGRGIAWSCSARTDRLDRELLEQLRESGCDGIYVGLETGSQRLQKVIKKNLDLQDAVQKITFALRLGFSITTSLIVGYPCETIADLRETLLLITHLEALGARSSGGRLTTQMHLYAPLADTPMVREGWRFAFDGELGNTVAIHRGLTDEERGLIEGEFAMFSAFYHPCETEYPRASYLRLTRTFDALHQAPEALRTMIDSDRMGFVARLLSLSMAEPSRASFRNGATPVQQHASSSRDAAGWATTRLGRMEGRPGHSGARVACS